ncbi:FkbM family methyltransferase [Candidatus Arthromitus sp. SFB-rat-Yit]|uniref:FkbM family methyltransferase n=1 Tax=Candidatus Arthromitus sp. SFB-rat-Yit TaxID=1041504 RepID=UPI000227A071|nr:FkbM family methyltransferase [Candidatus Arthromitus sp. SFB-rat-Yit]BAK81212.1 methyltransferase FkbM family [Candidatus Arthromitus sp. SFB-rat-Yit]
MNKSMINNISSLLEDVRKDIAYLQEREDNEVRQAVTDRRQVITQYIESMLGESLNNHISANKLDDAEWLGVIYHIVDYLAEPFEPTNAIDREFWSFLKYIWQNTEETLVKKMKEVLNTWEKTPNGKALYCGFVEYFEKYPLWGTFSPEQGDFDTFERRAAVLKRHSYDFLWLFRRLNDYLSKSTLMAILFNWAVLDIVYPQKVKSIFKDYWEPDIFSNNVDDVLVDVGAYVGDSIAEYLNMYGTKYKRIYAYDISPDICDTMRANIEKWNLHDVIICNKGTGSHTSEMFLNRSINDASANQLTSDENSGQRIKVVALDKDLPEPVTFLKMDIEGAEYDTLLGCKNIISRQSPPPPAKTCNLCLSRV